MKMMGIGHYIASREVQGKTQKYFFVKLVGEDEGEIELRSEELVKDIPKFAKVAFTCDVVQGQYNRFNLLGIKVAEKEDIAKDDKNKKIG